MLAETYWQLMADPAHWGFELTLELITGVVGAKLAWPWFKRYMATHTGRTIAEEHDLHGIEDHDHELHEQVAHNHEMTKTKILETSLDLAAKMLDQGDVRGARWALEWAQERIDENGSV